MTKEEIKAMKVKYQKATLKEKKDIRHFFFKEKMLEREKERIWDIVVGFKKE